MNTGYLLEVISKNKMELIYETTDKQKKEFQYGLYHKISKDLGIWAKVLNVIGVQKMSWSWLNAFAE